MCVCVCRGCCAIVSGSSCASPLVNPTVGRCGLQGAEWAGPRPREQKQREEVRKGTAIDPSARLQHRYMTFKYQPYDLEDGGSCVFVCFNTFSLGVKGFRRHSACHVLISGPSQQKINK